MYSLVAAIAFGSLFAILFKLFQRHGVDSLQAIGVNYATALIISLVSNYSLMSTTIEVGAWFVPALFAGLFMMAGFVTMNIATRSHGVAIATVAARVAFVVPVLCAFLFLGGDAPRWLASALVICSLLLIFPQRGNSVGGGSWRWVYPLLVFVSYGVANFMLKVCQQLVAKEGGGDAALVMVTATAFMAALIYTIAYYYMQPRETRAPFAMRNVWAGIVLGGVNMGCTYFLLKSLMVIESAVFYPVYNIAIVVIASLVGRVGFGERLSRMQYAGIAVALLAIVLFFG